MRPEGEKPSFLFFSLHYRDNAVHLILRNYWMMFSMIWWIINAEVCVICRSQRQITLTRGLTIHNIMRKPNSLIILLHIFLMKQAGKEESALWICKSLRTQHARGAWKLGRFWTWHDNPIAAADRCFNGEWETEVSLTPMSDQDRISPCNIYTISTR